jgi:hypothetical protein
VGEVSVGGAVRRAHGEAIAFGNCVEARWCDGLRLARRWPRRLRVACGVAILRRVRLSASLVGFWVETGAGNYCRARVARWWSEECTGSVELRSLSITERWACVGLGSLNCLVVSFSAMLAFDFVCICNYFVQWLIPSQFVTTMRLTSRRGIRRYQKRFLGR